jgi:hypothetical protein
MDYCAPTIFGENISAYPPTNNSYSNCYEEDACALLIPTDVTRTHTRNGTTHVGKTFLTSQVLKISWRARPESILIIGIDNK